MRGVLILLICAVALAFIIFGYLNCRSIAKQYMAATKFDVLSGCAVEVRTGQFGRV
jgi:hypothetical protein